MRLSDTDKSAIETQVATFEQATGAQGVVSVVDRCDAYPEEPWRAFALATALAGLFVWSVPLSGALLHHSTTLTLVTVLGAGAVAALLTIFLPATGRWLLPMTRCEAEVRQYAQAMFLTRELFATRERTAMLVLVGLYERCAVIVADGGLRERLPAGQLELAEAQLNAALRSGLLSAAVIQTLMTLQAVLPRSEGGAAHNEIADSLVHERDH
jgi:putative membrane protein